MAQPLAGYRVADFSHVMAGPFCSHFLRLLGAEVIKVENLNGDPMRRLRPFPPLGWYGARIRRGQCRQEVHCGEP